ncbi:unnamed protein product [Cyclocybe aegerita]|uniref:Uncharacterized protein n=1 Tax=Cyclocybe aegerita TaxID=1973307 RepID=A0A8S0WRF2_CYCAE|nr:unnamed protein product [Cyclocybe aegerita]
MLARYRGIDNDASSWLRWFSTSYKTGAQTRALDWLSFKFGLQHPAINHSLASECPGLSTFSPKCMALKKNQASTVGHAILEKWMGSEMERKYEERHGFSFRPPLTGVNDQYLLVRFMCNLTQEAIEKVIKDTELWDDVRELFGKAEDIMDKPPMWFRVGLRANPEDNFQYTIDKSFTSLWDI